MMVDAIYISGQKINIIYNAPGDWASDGLGRSSLKSGSIHIRHDMPQDIKTGTLMHEVIHMISALNDLKLDSEIVVSVLANSIVEVFRRNPEFAKEICG